jgi:hypothetical protein
VLIYEQLREQEDQLRRDDEVFYEAKRQAARVASKMRSDELAKRAAEANKSWASADEWEM